MKKIYFAPIVAFILFVMFLVVFEFYQGRKSFFLVIENRAKEVVEVVMSFRLWNASIGHVYGDTKYVVPNPYLEWNKNRDLVSVDDKKMTLVNPAYMTRMVGDILNNRDGIKMRMVGVRPVNPGNSAEDWHLKGLKSFLDGYDKYSEHVYDGIKHVSFRYMVSLHVESSCLACHSRNDFYVGDLIGGLSVEIPTKKAFSALFNRTLSNAGIYIIISAVLLAVIIFLQKKLYQASEKNFRVIRELNSEILKREMGESALVHQTKMASNGELLSMVAHHWRQPLTVISMTVQNLEDYIIDHGLKDAEIDHQIEMSLNTINELSRSIDLFKDRFSDREEVETFEIKSSVLDAVHMIEPLLKSYGIKVWIRCGNKSDVCVCENSKELLVRDCTKDNIFIYGIKNDFKQIFMAVLKNAYEAVLEAFETKGHDYGGAIAITITDDENKVYVSVSDNGVGMKKEDSSRAFEAYYTTKGFSFGKGLGLYIAKNLAQKFKNGDLILETGEGLTEFTFITDKA